MSRPSLTAIEWAPWMVLGATVALSFKGIAAKFAYEAGAGVGLASAQSGAVQLYVGDCCYLAGQAVDQGDGDPDDYQCAEGPTV